MTIFASEKVGFFPSAVESIRNEKNKGSLGGISICAYGSAFHGKKSFILNCLGRGNG